ncbi:MAG: glutamine-hydrolyzing GMP synthase [Patescibacteria group bacterium]|nr:glutamine-hydrolyzing GMP synthase [Patescibacteria group bacterium]
MLSTFKKATKSALEEVQEEMRVRQTKEVFLLFAMGSQFDHLIKQSLEKLGVFCLVADPSSVTADDVRELKPMGIILSGGPASVQTEPPPFDRKIFELEMPILGICLGFQMWADYAGFTVTASAGHREFGVHDATLDKSSKLFEGCGGFTAVLESHGDRVEPHDGLHVIAKTDNAPVAAARYHNLWGVQFHPEVTHTTHGLRMLENFCFRICCAKDCFPATNIAQHKIRQLREQIGEKRVLLALSGGSDSSTVAYLLKEALGGKSGRIRAIYIRGIDRPDDEAFVLKYFGGQDWLELKVVDATQQFLDVLAGHVTMKAKRVAMRGVYKAILEQEAEQFEASFIAQGTLYTDISESGGGYDAGARKAVIKQHHNTNLDFKLPELLPLADCVKDNGRNIGRTIGVPEELLVRHPFPGPGLVVRVEGEVTADKLAMARVVDCIWIEELRKWQLYDTVWQAGAVITQSVTTCTKGDDAASGVVVALWAVWSVNGFTATAAELPNDFLRHVARRITNEVRAVGAVVYRLSDKPPATIEWG